MRRRPESAIAGLGLGRWLLALLASVPLTAADAAPPVPFGPVPSERQLRWHELEFYGFLHFGPNTFTDREWSFGDESPAVFHPTAFDAGQIARTASEAGMRGLILVAKHHDGFCLWPTATTPHSVKASPWRGAAAVGWPVTSDQASAPQAALAP